MSKFMRYFLLFTIFGTQLVAQELADPCASGACGYMPESYEEIAAVEESYSNFVKHRGLAKKIDLSNRMPPVGSQGQQGSCVAWSTAYALKSYHEKVKRKWQWDAGDRDDNRCNANARRVFSPAYVYNQINGGRDNGSSIYNALQLTMKQGIAPCNYMPYNVKDYRKQPSSAAKKAAKKYRAKDFRKLDMTNIDAIKGELAKGNPVIFGGKVYRELHKLRAKNPIMDRYTGAVSGGHAMVLVGYDDNLKLPRGGKGAFKLINSWGTWWGAGGYGYISYSIWPDIAKYGYVLYDSDSSLDPVSDADEIKAPLKVSASKGSLEGKVQVSWSLVQGASAYEIQRSISQKDNFRKLSFTLKNSYMDKSVQPGLAYEYRVIAVSDDLRSKVEDSPVAEGFSLVKNEAPPIAVVDMQVEAKVIKGKSAGRLSWSYPTQATFEIIRFKTGEKKWKKIKKRTKKTEFEDKKLSAGTYFYNVRAKVGDTYGPWGQTVSMAIGGGDKEPPKVSGFKASDGTYADKIQLSWNRSPGADSYFIWRYNTKTQKWDKSFQTKSNKYTDSSPEVKSGQYYVYAVLAQNKAGQSPYSEYAYGRGNPAVARSAFTTLPPENLLTKINQEGFVTLNWSSAKNADYYHVFRKDFAGDFEFIATVDSPTVSYQEKLPSADKIFFYMVRSQNEMGAESADSNIAAAVLNSEPIQVSHRFIPGDGLDNFSGEWRGSIWSGGSDEARIEFRVIPDKESPGKFSLFVSVDGKQTTEKGEYASGARTLVTKSLKVEMLGDKNEKLRVQYGQDFNDKFYFREVLTKE